jgi:hypothetical protein
VAAAADPDTDRARGLFDEAGQLEREGRWSAAQDRLRGALRLRDTPHLHYALGWALENDDNLLEAKGEYEASMRLARGKAGSEEVVRLAGMRLADLEKKVATIKVRLTGPARATGRIVLDSHEVKADTVVNPGSHVLRVERGEGASEQMVYVGRGVVRMIEVDVREPPAPASEKLVTATELRLGPQASGPSESRESVLPWLLTTGGLAFVVGGAALLGSAAADSDSADTKQSFGLGLGGLGFVAVSVGAVMLLRGEMKPVLVRF